MTESGPDSVERISRDEPPITEILEYIQALWMRVIALEILEMRVPRGLFPFILPEPAETSSTTLSPESPVSTVDPCEPVEPSTVGPPDNPCEGEAPTSTSPPVSTVDPCEPVEPSTVVASDNPCEGEAPTSTSSPVSPADFSEPVEPVEPVTLLSADASCVNSSYTHDEIEAAEALLHSFTSSCYQESTEKELTVFPWCGMTSTGVNLNNTCPLDNWLMIFQALVKLGKVNLADLPESGHTIGSALRLIDDDQFADAKLLMVQSLPQQPQGVSALFLCLYLDISVTKREVVSRNPY